MSPAENKRAKRRKNKKIRSDPRNGSGAEAHPNIPLGCLSSKLENRAAEEVELEPNELNNGSFREMRCLVCNSEPPEQPQHLPLSRGSADGCEDGKENLPGSLKVASQLQWYICPSCKTSGEDSLSANGFGDYLPLSFVADNEVVRDTEICSCKSCFDQTYFSELTKKSAAAAACSLGLDNGGVVGGLPHLPHHLQRENSKDEEVHRGWQDLKMLVHQTYREAGLTLGEALTPHLPPQSQGASIVFSEHRIKEIVSNLSRQDAHKLYLCLESQVKLFVVEMRLRLLMQVRGATPNGSSSAASTSSKPFVCLMLEEYAKLCSAAAQVAPYLEELEISHLKGFKLTWELVNRHLFQSIVYDDPLLHSRLTVNLSQHRMTNGNGSIGSSGRDKCLHDSFSAVTKFDDEMTVLSVLWREAEQLIEAYNQGQAARAKQGLELLHAQMKQLMEEELNLSLFQRYPLECQKSCSHGVKGHCPTGSSSSPNFLSPSELVSLAEQADGHTPCSNPASASLNAAGSKEGEAGLPGGWSPVCIKSAPFYAKMARTGRFFPDILDSYQNLGQECIGPESAATTTEGAVLPGSVPLPPSLLPLTPNPLGEGIAGNGCCRLQQNSVSGAARDLNKQLASPTKHSSTEHGVNHPQLLQTTKNSASFKGGGLPPNFTVGARHLTGHPSSSSTTNNSGPDSKGGCECHSCSQMHHGHEHPADTHVAYEGATKQRDISPNLLTGLKSMFAEACGSPSALAAVKQLIHPHLYKVHNNTNPNNNNNNTSGGAVGGGNSPGVSKTTSAAPSRPNGAFFPEPFDLKLEMQGILREQIRLATMGDWDYDVDEARSLFLHHYQNSVRPHRTSGTSETAHFDLPALQLPPLSTPSLPNKFFSPVGLEEAANSHSVLRNSLPNPPGVCHACKVDPDTSPPRVGSVGEALSNISVINNLGHTGRKSACQQARELGGLIPEGYGSVDCVATNGRHPQTSNLPASPPNSSTASSTATTPATTPSNGGGGGGGSLASCSANGGNSGSSSSLSSMGTADRGVGGHGCCENHVPDGGEESGPDDSCSERSSSTSTSNQRESRVCDCCYCEPVVAPVSRNYPEIRDRLRMRLSKRKAEGGSGGVVTNIDKNEPLEDSRGLEELLKYINGTEEEKNKQRKTKRKGPKRGDTTNNPNNGSSLELSADVEGQREKEDRLLDLLNSLKRVASLEQQQQQTAEQQPKQNSHSTSEPTNNQSMQKTKKSVTESQNIAAEQPAASMPATGCAAEPHKMSRHQQSAKGNVKQHQNGLSQDHAGKGNNERLVKNTPPLSTRQKTVHPAGVQNQQQQRIAHLSSSNLGTKKPLQLADKLVNGNALLAEEVVHHLQIDKKNNSGVQSTKATANSSLSPEKGTLANSQAAVGSSSSSRAESSTRESPKRDRNSTTVITNCGVSPPDVSHQNHHHHMNGSLSPKEIIAAATCMDVKSNVRSKKNRKKKNGNDDGTSPDDVFMPKDIDLENGELDEFEKELEAFKRFCFNSVPLANKEKVHVNLKDIVVKKKGASNGVTLSNGHKF